MLEYRRAEHRPWVAELVLKHFKASGRAADETIDAIEEYFETLIYDDDVPLAVCRTCLEKALKERGAENMYAILERARSYALSTL